MPCAALQGSTGEMLPIDRQLRIFSSQSQALKKCITQRITKKGLEIGDRGAGQEERRSVGYLDVSMMTSKGPSGIYTEERKGMPGNQSFEVYSESRKEVLSRDREHRRITYGWEKVVARDLSIRKRFSRAVSMMQSLCCQRRGGRKQKKA